MTTLSRLWLLTPPVALILVVIFSELIAPLDPNQISDDYGLFVPLSEPSLKHWLGTNSLGMDLWSRTVHGTKTVVFVSFLVVSLSFIIGVSAGLFAGWIGGFGDKVLASFFDFAYGMPGVLLAIGFSFGFSGGRPSYLSTVLAVVLAESLTFSAKYFYVVRSSVLSIKGELFVIASAALGASAAHILKTHFLPNLIRQTLPLTAQSASGAISTLAGLGFLGLGIGYGLQPEWGFDLGQSIGPMMMGNHWPLAASLVPLLLLLLWLSHASETLLRNSGQQRETALN